MTRAASAQKAVRQKELHQPAEISWRGKQSTCCSELKRDLERGQSWRQLSSQLGQESSSRAKTAYLWYAFHCDTSQNVSARWNSRCVVSRYMSMLHSCTADEQFANKEGSVGRSMKTAARKCNVRRADSVSQSVSGSSGCRRVVEMDTSHSNRRMRENEEEHQLISYNSLDFSIDYGDDNYDIAR